MATAAAQGCQHNLVRRQRTDWQSEAKIADPNAECTAYSYPPVQAMIKSYPTIWEIANLSQPGIDPMAIELYHKISPNIPNIKVKGTPTGDFTAFTPTYPSSDPDCWWSFQHCTTPKLAGLPPDIWTCPEPDTWGLTLDDGPNCSHNAYYDFLRQSNQKATLFYIGSNVIDWPLEAQRGLADDHEICGHTWSHPYMTGLTNEQVFAELYFTKKIIKDLLGVTILCWRPPFGDIDDRVRYIANALGLSTILWDNDMNDFRYITSGQAAVDANYQHMLDTANKGGFKTKGTLVLTHELNADTMATNQKFLPKIAQAFKYITPVAVCQNNTHPYLESEYSYPVGFTIYFYFSLLVAKNYCHYFRLLLNGRPGRDQVTYRLQYPFRTHHSRFVIRLDQTRPHPLTHIPLRTPLPPTLLPRLLLQLPLV
ncbi:hypothetical protein CROQUDRAFT_43880 [Cronartium quercuum f. sp. fusiforme G11]|uniref:chitin deacetylase n=1 Tax=Cronartium quercuum f. sp. fusiforme G11 TaxID=708437 RepID=A0A9P6NNH9_9BASI|nr:hypothetical protein CROQUDRAFT_43880 [Cronartium quercuum f. sp. fusiforme G11]